VGESAPGDLDPESFSPEMLNSISAGLTLAGSAASGVVRR